MRNPSSFGWAREVGGPPVRGSRSTIAVTQKQLHHDLCSRLSVHLRCFEVKVLR